MPAASVRQFSQMLELQILNRLQLSGYSRLPISTLSALSKVDFRRPDDRFRPTFRAPDDPLPTSSLTVNEPDRTINSSLGLPPVFPANGQPRARHLGRAGRPRGRTPL